MAETRIVGITVLPEYIQTEGIDGVLDNLVTRARATAVSISPYVMAPADERTGTREPPADAEAGKVRLLDRPLWGKRELFVTTAPSFTPDKTLYAGLRYQPAEPTELTAREGGILAEFIAAAQARGLKVYHQVQAAIPPGYRVQFGGPEADDLPRLPDGRAPEGRVDKNGSLGSPHIRAYARALIQDLVRAYPAVDGFRIDWPEYPPYSFDSLFLDFSDHAAAAAKRLGFDFDRMRADTGALHDGLLGGLTEADLSVWTTPEGGRYRLLQLLRDHPGVADLLRFKAALSIETIAELREALTEAGGVDKELIPSTFPPPWSAVSGASYGGLAPLSTAIGVKLYTMHWPMMLRFYADALCGANPGLERARVVRALVGLLDISDDEGLDDYAYPGPDEPHPVGEAAQRRKIAAARAEAGETPVIAMAHGYGPVADVRQRLACAYGASGGRLWVNRYGYLSDEKLDLIGEVTAPEG